MNKTIFIAAILLLIFGSAIQGQTTAFVFQGKLQDAGQAANGTYQFQFRLFDAAAGGNQIGQVLTDVPATVTNGIFAATLDFGTGSFDGAERFIEVGVRANGSGQSYTILNPRQAVSSTPYAVRSLNSEQATIADNSLNLGGIPANQYVITNDARLSDERNPLPDSPNYIQNTTDPQTVSNFNISGTGSANIFNASTQFNIGGNRVFHLTGAFNTFVGFESGNAISGGTSNSFFGIFAGRNTTDGSNNSFFGSYAGRDNITGSENSFFGQGAGLKNTLGAGNSLFGYGAGINNTTGTNNTFVGYVAGQSNTTEEYNTFLGYRANGTTGITNATAIGANAVVTTSNTMVLGTNAVTVFAPGSFNTSTNYKIGGSRVFHLTGANNTFVGLETGNSITGGTFNAFFGKEAGKMTTTGGNNSFFGSLAGRDNLSGNDNSFFGQAAGLQNTTGASNSFFGYGAGVNNTFGASNTFFGYLAGQSNTTENENTFIGYKANGAAGLTNVTAIGANAFATQSNTLVLGTNLVTVQVPGNLTVANTFSANALNSATVYQIGGIRVFHLTGTDNTSIGLESGNSITSGGFNAFYGTYAGKSTTTGSNNSFFGSYAGRGNTIGLSNSFFGANAGLSNKDGSFNAFFGNGAGFSNINGANNSYFGNQSGLNNSTGDNNSFFGSNAGKSADNSSFNSFFGSFTGEKTTTGAGNTFVGAFAGRENNIGFNNTFVGYKAGQTPTTGNNNVIIGYNASFTSGVSNSVAIGANVSVLQSNTINIGSGAMTIYLAGDVNADDISTNSLSTGNLSASSLSASNSEIINLKTEKIEVNPGNPSNTEVADFNGTIQVRGIKVGNAFIGGVTPVCSSGSGGFFAIVACSSSLRYKDNVQDFTRGLDLLRQLRPVTFSWKSGGAADVGFIAEEVNRAEPRLATFNDKGEVEGVKYAQVTTVLVNSVKELETQIEATRAENQKLQERLKQQQSQIDALKSLLCQQTPNAAVCAVPEKE